ncbi:hypothetical protein [Salibacter halophilus]|uniref:Carboxypeptidase-like regulatory domain-containing protein n=1 Tax=Salibacter halophilus TaxID=1803916 RepID=A0A6N6M828_9FLAO|nr:hypothetical protein [Salibacter halophilus]KAB1064911.1 hypothetical protein F3059_06040 [Salibacter halophilus]
MKYWFVFIFILSTVLTNAQTRLDGKYCRADDNPWYESDCIKFNQNGTFEYVMLHCTGATEGSGIYTIQNGNLNLNFLNPDTLSKTDGRVGIKQYDLTDNQEASIKVTLFDILDSSKIQFAKVVLYDSLNNSQINEASTDSLGTANLKIEKANQLTISMVGYKKLIIPIPINKNLKLEVGLASTVRTRYLSAEDSMSFPIKRIKDDKFLLKRYENMDYLNYEIESD